MDKNTEEKKNIKKQKREFEKNKRKKEHELKEKKIKEKREIKLEEIKKSEPFLRKINPVLLISVIVFLAVSNILTLKFLSYYEKEYERNDIYSRQYNENMIEKENLRRKINRFDEQKKKYIELKEKENGEK